MIKAGLQPFTERQALIFRLTIGIVFGLALAYLAFLLETYRPDYSQISKPLPSAYVWQQIAFMVISLSAFIYWAGAAAMRRVSLLVWGLIAMALIAWIGWGQYQQSFNPTSGAFWDGTFLLFPFLFITHELISSADQAAKPIAPYALYFDQAWKRGVQLALSILFTLLLWGILWLGAALLGFIGFGWFKDLLMNKYFSFPITGLALGASVHLSDVQTKLLANVRALILGVLSWLLPVIVLVGLIFAVSLCFSCLEPLWKTRAATATLLGACLGLVLLINAAYQQGDEERPVNFVLKIAARLGCGLVLIFSVLAAYALGLRIEQYGLTPSRIMALVGVIVAVMYGIGYAMAAVFPGRWLRLLEPFNIAFAIIKSVIFLCVLTPIAAPARLSVDNQVARLEKGKASIDTFDWGMLRFDTGTYGLKALDRLEKDGKTAAIRKKAEESKALTERSSFQTPEPVGIKPDLNRLNVITPKGMILPQSFLDKSFSPDGYDTPDCIKTTSQAICDVAMLDLNRDSAPEIVLLHKTQIFVYAQKDGVWTAKVVNFTLTEAATKAFAKGKISTQEPDWNDLKIGDQQIDMNNYK